MTVELASGPLAWAIEGNEGISMHLASNRYFGIPIGFLGQLF